MTTNFSMTGTPSTRLSVLITLCVFLLSFYCGPLLAQTTEEVTEEELPVDTAFSDLQNQVLTIESQVTQIEDKLEQSRILLDTKGVEVTNNSVAAKQLQQELATLSSGVRANVAELYTQKSLIEDNSVRLYNILIRVSNALETLQELENKSQENKQTDSKVVAAQIKSLDLQLQKFWSLILLVLMLLTPIAFTLSNGGLTQRGIFVNFSGLTLGYLLVGFGVMYGTTNSGWIGSPIFLFGEGASSQANSTLLDNILHQTTLVVFAGLVVRSVISERFSDVKLLLIALVVSIFLIPIFSHWVWAEQFITTNTGWLKEWGFVDQSKVTTMGLLAAWFAATILWRLPPPENNKPIASEPVYSVGTALFFYLAWIGFTAAGNDSSELSFTSVALNTILAASAASITVFIQQMVFYPNQNNDPIAYIPSAFVSGLVAIATCIQTVTHSEALVIGIVAGVLYRLTLGPLSRLMRQQTGQGQSAGLISIHVVAGIWGLMCVGLFGPLGNFTFPDIIQLTGQLKGAVVAIVYSTLMAVVAVVLFRPRKKKNPQPASTD